MSIRSLMKDKSRYFITEISPCLRSTPILDIEHSEIKLIVSKYTDTLESDMDKFEALLQFMRKDIDFAFVANPLKQKASDVLKAKKGDFITKAVLFATLCRAAGIASRLLFFMNKEETELLANHLGADKYSKLVASVECFIDGKWQLTESFLFDSTLAKHLINKELPKTDFPFERYYSKDLIIEDSIGYVSDTAFLKFLISELSIKKTEISFFNRRKLNKALQLLTNDIKKDDFTAEKDQNVVEKDVEVSAA